MMETPPYLLIGLGNPGREYRENRHNVGFMVIDRLCVRLNVPMNRLQSNALVGSARHAGRRLILAKPQTFMNLSGSAAKGLVRFYKVPLENVLVIHDDLDLPFGVLRLRPGGGSGGHKGVASVIESLRSQAFPRLRVGIGRPPGNMDPADYVLQDFPEEAMFDLSALLERAADAALAFVSEGIGAAMNRFNRPTEA